MPDYELKFTESEKYHYFLRHSERASRMTIRIHPDLCIEVVVPRCVAEKDAHAFIQREIVWVRTALKKMERKRGKVPKKKESLYPHEFHFALTGNRYKINYLWEDVCWTAAKIRDAENIDVAGAVLEPENMRNALLGLIRRTAEQVLPPMLAGLAEKHRFPMPETSIRFQKRRWGSCSSRGSISLNAFLVFFSPEIVEYIMIHELCHMREMNHSSAFWGEVEKICPDAKFLKRCLNKESRKLPPLWENA